MEGRKVLAACLRGARGLPLRAKLASLLSCLALLPCVMSCRLTRRLEKNLKNQMQLPFVPLYHFQIRLECVLPGLLEVKRSKQGRRRGQGP